MFLSIKIRKKITQKSPKAKPFSSLHETQKTLVKNIDLKLLNFQAKIWCRHLKKKEKIFENFACG